MQMKDGIATSVKTEREKSETAINFVKPNRTEVKVIFLPNAHPLLLLPCGTLRWTLNSCWLRWQLLYLG